jgi:hypothetical protein
VIEMPHLCEWVNKALCDIETCGSVQVTIAFREVPKMTLRRMIVGFAMVVAAISVFGGTMALTQHQAVAGCSRGC